MEDVTVSDLVGVLRDLLVAGEIDESSRILTRSDWGKEYVIKRIDIKNREIILCRESQ